MLPANLISALQALTNAGNRPDTATGKAPDPAAKLEPGQQFQATVLSKISEGLFKVQVAGQTLQMRLPGNIQRGDVIRLVVISTQPRITFGMVASTNPLSTPEEIGSSARMLSNLAASPLEHPVVEQLGNKAVWQAEQAVPDTKLLAGALREALGKSGLFYESHQAQWIRGERSTNQLLAEPQNVLTGRNPSQSSAVVRQTVPNSVPASGLPDMQKTTRLLPGIDTPAPATKPEQSAATSSDAALPVAKELVQLVQQQLHTLENHHLVWLGQIWPGQQMQWEIQGEPEHPTREQDERQWSTEIELALPRLGDVHARLIFSNSGLRLTLHAADPSTVELFNRSLPALRDSLAGADIPLLAAVAEKS
ncbi:MAG TPA: flagellar hook-length control protein FliK [Gallionella sp.]|nr:flagellar hook-length control protein FliK [Gallionella sp.]